MEKLDEFIEQALNEEFKRRFETFGQKDRVVSALMSWLTVTARKKPVPDLEDRLKAMQKDFEHMVEDMRVEIAEGKLVVKVRGSGEDTLKKLKLGTSWFEGSEDILELILTGLFDE